MRIRTDDELRRVDARWLGPPRVSFPWPATRYVAYGVGFVVFLLVGWLFARFAEVTFWTMLYTLLITIGVTGWICKRIDDERPLSTLPAVLWAELGTHPACWAYRPHPHRGSQWRGQSQRRWSSMLRNRTTPEDKASKGPEQLK